MSVFKRYPITKTVLYMGGLFGTSDVLSQYLTMRDEFTTLFSPYRTLRAAVYGGLIFGPFATKVTYPFVANIGKGRPFWQQGVMRVAVDQAFIAPFLYLPMYFSGLALLEGHSLSTAVERVQQNWWNVVQVGWAVWVPVQFINLTLVPMQFRVLVGGFVGLLWNAYMAVKNREAGQPIDPNHPPDTEYI